MPNVHVYPHHSAPPEDDPVDVEVFRADISLLIEVPDDVPRDLYYAWVCDLMSETLRNITVDWAYTTTPRSTVVTSPYCEGSFFQ